MRILLKYVLIASVIIAMPILAHAADMKIAVVNTQDVLLNSEAGKRVSQQLQSTMEAKQKEINNQGQELQKAQDELNKKGAVMSADAKQKEQAALDARIKKFMDDRSAAGQSFEQEKNKIIAPLTKLLDQVVADYAKKNGYSIIIDSMAVPFVAAGADVTAEIKKDFEAAASRAK